MTGFLRAEARRFGKTVLWSVQGWQAAWATEKTLRQWTLVNVISAAAALALPLSVPERALLLALGLLVLAAELMNTGIEKAVDLIGPAEHPLAKKAKDCGSAAVALTALAGGVAWVVVLLG